MGMDTSFWKMVSTSVIWAIALVSLIMTGIFIAPQIGEDAIGVVFIAFGAAVVSTGFIWNWGQVPGAKKDKKSNKDEDEETYYNASQKQKNDQIASSLRDMSDEELVELRRRLSTGEIDEAELESMLSRR